MDDDDDDAARSMAMLESGVPLSLLLDLALGPDSEGKLSEERQPAPLSPSLAVPGRR